MSATRRELGQPRGRDLQGDLEVLVQTWHAQVDHARAEEGPLRVPRVDADSPDAYPAAWHRSVGLAAGRPLVWTTC